MNEVNDIDIVPSLHPANLWRLTSVLTELKVNHWSVPNWPVGVGPARLDDFDDPTFSIARYANDTLMIDVHRQAGGRFGYDTLKSGGRTIRLDNKSVVVPDIEDMIAIRKASIEIATGLPELDAHQEAAKLARKDKETRALELLTVTLEVQEQSASVPVRKSSGRNVSPDAHGELA